MDLIPEFEWAWGWEWDCDSTVVMRLYGKEDVEIECVFVKLRLMRDGIKAATVFSFK